MTGRQRTALRLFAGGLWGLLAIPSILGTLYSATNGGLSLALYASFSVLSVGLAYLLSTKSSRTGPAVSAIAASGLAVVGFIAFATASDRSDVPNLWFVVVVAAIGAVSILALGSPAACD